MVLLPEERGMTLVELRQMAARQQHQIEAQQQLLVAKEQRLKFLKQQEARHHSLQEDTLSLLSLRDKVESQELKLRQLRALRGQVEQQKTNNGNLGTELESIRALFCEKEKELDLAVSKVEELTRQLDEIQKNSRKNCLITSSSELENLKRDLLYRTKLSEQQNNYICQQRDKIAYRQQDIANLDKKINELNKRLHRKRLLNEQFASQIYTVSLARASSGSILSTNTFLKTESQELAESEHAQDDLAATLHGHHSSDLGEFSLTKNDPKYQTLPYNTKFTLKDKQSEDSLSSSTEDESWYLHHEDSTSGTNTASHINIYNIPPHPFKSSATELHKIEVQETQNNVDKTSEDCSSSEVGESKNDSHPVEIRDLDIPPKPKSQSILSRPNSKSMNKPAVPPKPALSVKPMLTNSMTSFKRKTEPDTVNMALTFLKNKSSEKEKSDISNYRERLLYYQCIPRFSTVRDSTQDPLLPKSRILTYFSKTLLQPEDSIHDPKIAPNITPKRKSGFGQLPIKPKPLTIRKTPGIEPPKLKVQPVAALNSHRKTLESQPIPLTVKVSKNLATSENDEKSIFLPNSSDNGFLKVTSKTEVGKNDHSQSESSDTLDKNESDSEIIEKQDMDDGSVTDEQVEATDQSDSSIEPLGVVQKLKKGNLKCEGTIRGSRRVSFDPLALLLDAALEGELELVKKTANEVVNASAANDEGITALHNAICAGHFDVVRFLVQFGCDVNAQDSDGWTPLHCAASCNNLAMVKFLVERGACIFATTLSDQETAAEKCEEDEEGFDGCSEYLFSLQENLGIINNCVVYAVYDYDGQNADELSFRNGDKLTVLRKSDNEENEWWWSRLHDEEGYIPRNLLGLYPRVAKECPADG